MMDGTAIVALAQEFKKPQSLYAGPDHRAFVPDGWKEMRPFVAAVEPVKVGTLTGLVEYLKTNVDTLTPGDLIVHVKDAGTALVLGKLGEETTEYRRHAYLVASTGMVSGTPYPFGQWLDKEQFMIALQTGFVPSGEREQALKLVASISENAVRETTDDGVSQGVKTARSVTMAENSRVPNPILLRPYRTFREVDQPGSLFVFRLREGKEAPMCALFEADGGAWKLEAVRSIAAYLTAALGTGYAVIG